MEEAARIDPSLRLRLESMDDAALNKEAAGVGRLVVLHEYIIDCIRDSIVESQREIFGYDGSEQESETQILLSDLCSRISKHSCNPQLLNRARTAALRTFRELLGPESVQEAQMGGRLYFPTMASGSLLRVLD